MFYGRDKTAILRVGNPETRLPVAELQNFLDDFLAAAAEAAQAGATRAGAGLDYIHGMDELTRLWREEDCVCFALPPIDKSGLFPTIARDGVLPRKAFSMGEAREKRYYLEARKIIK